MILDDIAAYLITKGVAVAPPPNNADLPDGAWPVYEGYFPDDVDQTMGVFETIGQPALTMNRDAVGLSFQMRVRGLRLNYAATHAQWQACFDALQDSQPTPAYALVQAAYYGPMTFNDDRGRPNFITNFKVVYVPGAA